MKTILLISTFCFVLISVESKLTYSAELNSAVFIRQENARMLSSNYSNAISAKLEVPFSAEGTPTKIYSHGNPTDKEQYMLELINRARANPLEEIKRILNENDAYVESAIDTYKISVTNLISEFSGYPPVAPLAFNSELISAARKHAQDMSDNDFQGHIGSDGSTLKQRLNQAGYEYKTAGENVFAYAQSVEHAHAAFLVDWGVEDIGHRKNELGLIDSSNFREIGIAIISENSPATSVGPLVVAENFGRSYSGIVFITGVVFRDSNNNNFYDPGEGLGDVTVMPNHGTYYAITSSSGGYAIPVIIDSGEYDLHIVRSDLPELHLTVEIAKNNVEADFKLGDPNFGTIKGQVFDKQTNKTLENVVITLKPINAQYTTSSNGEFIFSDLPAANYILTAQLNGYIFEPDNFGISLSSGQNVRIKLQAEKTSVPQAENIENNSNSNNENNLIPIGGTCSGPAVIFMFIFFVSFKTICVRNN